MMGKDRMQLTCNRDRARDAPGLYMVIMLYADRSRITVNDRKNKGVMK